MSKGKVTLYIARHGKTMFNTIQRTQGWSDTPLTKEGIQGVTALGIGVQDIPFTNVYSSDSGRAIETAKLILAQHKIKNIAHHTDPRIREWCFGSLEGGYDGELWGVVPRVLAFKNYNEMMQTVTYEQLAEAIQEADTANWSETYQQIKERIWNGFTDIAKKTEKNGGGNVLVVSHGMTISNLLNLIDDSQPIQQNLLNASISKLEYQNGEYSILSINDTSYIEKGRKKKNQ